MRLHLYLFATYRETRQAFQLAANLSQLMGDEFSVTEMEIRDEDGVVARYMPLSDRHDMLRLMGYRPEKVTISRRVEASLAKEAIARSRSGAVDWV